MSKYFSRLAKEILDDHNLFVEFLLMWIATCLTVLAVATIVSAIGGMLGAGG
jgi:hypothetical protein